MANREWPPWWTWALDLSPHLLKRMVDRQFTEVELREMMENASSLGPDFVEGRWIIQTRHRQQAWEVIVEPDDERELLVVVTAYPVDTSR